MSKAERIRKHYEDGFLTVAEIARLVGCKPEYVRVVARQRVLSGNESIHDKRWRQANKSKIRQRVRERYRTDPDYREKLLTYLAQWRRRNRGKMLEAAE